MANNDDIRTLLSAVSFAARAHKHQLRKDKETPYVAHVFRVCLVLRDVFGIEDRRAMTAAVLHDTIEDTNTDFDEIAEEFDKDIAEWVSLLSKDKRLLDEVREKEYCDRLQKAPWQVQVCKLADMFDNLMDIGNQPAEKRGKTVQRVEQYLEVLSHSSAKEVQGPLQKVRGLLEQTR